jgi:phage terminase Nu1 subunit (DNA packaging protein)
MALRTNKETIMLKNVTLTLDVPDTMEDGRLHDLIQRLIDIGLWDAEETLNECDDEDRDALDALCIKIKSIEVSN